MEINYSGDVGVIVGRFMVHELHAAHIDLIKTVKERHNKVIIILGLSELRNTINNPLDFKSRKQLIFEHFPDIEVHYISDVPCDKVWSKNLDSLILRFLNPQEIPILYGARDSFIEHYCGKFTTVRLESNSYISGTETRKRVSASYHPSKDYRAGLIAATAHRYPIAYQTVDIAILRGEEDVLMVRKPNESKWRFVGGFSDPSSNSLEEDAKREVAEETGGIEVSNMTYIGSCKIDDWRYKKEKDSIKTAFFICNYVFGSPVGSDDVCECKWFKISELNEATVVSGHLVLVKMLGNFLN
jgi:bifunctional NMN adenylyltransferase/nudix hydrolase